MRFTDGGSTRKLREGHNVLILTETIWDVRDVLEVKWI